MPKKNHPSPSPDKDLTKKQEALSSSGNDPVSRALALQILQRSADKDFCTRLSQSNSAELLEMFDALLPEGQTLNRNDRHQVFLISGIFDYFEHSTQIKAEIKELINQLKLPLLSLCLVSPLSINYRQHSVRLLLNEISQLSLYWEADNSQTAPILNQLKLTVDTIKTNTHSVESLQTIVQQSTRQFAHFSDNYRNRIALFEKRIYETYQGKLKTDQANQWAVTTTRYLLNTCPSGTEEFVRDFVQSSWKHVLFLAYLRSPQKEGHEVLRIAKALIISLQQVENIDSLEKFLELQPYLINGLQQQVNKTPLSHAEIDTFFEQLALSHSAIISHAKAMLEKGPKEEILRLKPDQLFAIEAKNSPDKTQTPDIPVTQQTLEHWIEQNFERLGDSNSIDHQPEQQINPTGQNDAGQTGTEPLLEAGCWVRIKLSGKTKQYKLTAYIPQRDQYVFIDGSGVKKAEFKGAQLSKMLSNGALKPLESILAADRAFKLIKNKFKESDKRAQRTTMEELPQKTEAPQSKLTCNKTREELANDIAGDQPKTSLDTEIQTASTPDEKSSQVIQVVNLLKIGSWVEIELDGRLKRCRFAARTRKDGRFIFTDRDGIKIKQATALEIAELHRENKLIIKKEDRLFDHALSSVISSIRNQKK